jgi:RNA polymerase sigma-70 factor (ECF subfamily)
VFDPTDDNSDAQLMARIQRGETELFSELVARYEPALRRVARSRLGRADWADDVVQETFLSAFKSRATFDPQYSFRTWLWTILLRNCHAHYHRRQRSVPVEPLDSDTAREVSTQSEHGGAPLAQLLAKERAEQLELLLAQLSMAQADALRLRFFGELKFHEIADAMQCSLNTAKNRVRTGLERMAQLLQLAGAPNSSRQTHVSESIES